MKLKLIILLVTINSSLFTFSSCSNDDDSSSNNQNVAQLQGAIVQGKWRVSNFVEDGNNQSHHFNGFAFTFSENGIVSATNGTTTVTGTWITSSSSSSGSKFILSFNVSNGPFEEISEDWRIESTSASKIDLKHISGGDGSIDLLTFVKI